MGKRRCAQLTNALPWWVASSWQRDPPRRAERPSTMRGTNKPGKQEKLRPTEIGRDRPGRLKIRCPPGGVRVRVPPPALRKGPLTPPFSHRECCHKRRESREKWHRKWSIGRIRREVKVLDVHQGFLWLCVAALGGAIGLALLAGGGPRRSRWVAWRGWLGAKGRLLNPPLCVERPPLIIGAPRTKGLMIPRYPGARPEDRS